MTKKFFFMAILTANLQGRPQVQFNVVTAGPARNILAADLVRIQNQAAVMMDQAGVQYDDLPIHNIFLLAENVTEAEFTANTDLGNAPEPAAPEPEVEPTADNVVALNEAAPADSEVSA